jgi:hypothetical protein
MQRTKCGLATALVTLAVLSNVLLMLPVFSSADARVRGWPPQDLDWQTFLIPEFGTTVDYPTGIFSVSDGKAEMGFGQRFTSADGGSVLTIYTRDNEDDDTPASYPKLYGYCRAQCFDDQDLSLDSQYCSGLFLS